MNEFIITYDTTYQGYPLRNVLNADMSGSCILMVKQKKDWQWNPSGCFQLHKRHPNERVVVDFTQPWIGIGKAKISWEPNDIAIIYLTDLENHLLLHDSKAPICLSVSVERI